MTDPFVPAARRRLYANASELAVAAIVMVVSLVRLFWLYRLPGERLVQYLPDDAFYYICLARNFAHLGRWTFDAVAPATGFHLLWGYLLAGAFKLRPGLEWRTIFLLSGLGGCGCLSLASFLICRVARGLFGVWSLVGIGCFFFSEGMLWQTTFVMESPLVLLCGALSLYLIYWAGGNQRFRWMLPVVFFTGMAGTLSRSDFGLLPFWLALVFCWQGWQARRWTAELRAALAVLAGACGGVVLVLVHCYVVSGQWTQASAKEKLLWATLAGRSIEPPVIEIFTPLQPLGWFAHHVHARLPGIHLAALFGMSMAAACLLAFLQARQRGLPNRWEGKLLTFGFAATMVSYMFVYRLDSQAVQPWYLASVATPIACVFGGASAWLVEHSRKVILPVFLVLAFVGVRASVQSVWPGQEAFYEAALQLKSGHVAGPVGAWNAGILGYFSGAAVVNLDGLVNDDIYAYSVRAGLLEYIAARQMVAVADSDRQFRFDTARLGISGQELSSCFLPPRLIGQVDPVEERKLGADAGSEVRLRVRVPCR